MLNTTSLFDLYYLQRHKDSFWQWQVIYRVCIVWFNVIYTITRDILGWKPNLYFGSNPEPNPVGLNKPKADSESIFNSAPEKFVHLNSVALAFLMLSSQHKLALSMSGIKFYQKSCFKR